MERKLSELINRHGGRRAHYWGNPKDRCELVEQAIHIEKLAAAEHARAERQLDIHFARQYRDKAKLLEKNAKDLRQQAKKLEKSRDGLEQRRQGLENQMREV